MGKISNPMRLFRSQEGKEVKYIRISNLGHYYYCAVQAWLIAQGIDSKGNINTEQGTKLHNACTAARQPSVYEKAFEDFLNSQMKTLSCGHGSTGVRDKSSHDAVLTREWVEEDVVLGEVVTHGLDDFKVFPDKTVKLYEYKFTNQRYIDWFKLGSAVFQMKASIWLYTPILERGGYRITGAELCFFNMKGEPLGTKQVDYDEVDFLRQVKDILQQFRHPETLIPPARWKCIKCGDHFKQRCPFQTQPQTQENKPQ